MLGVYLLKSPPSSSTSRWDIWRKLDLCWLAKNKVLFKLCRALTSTEALLVSTPRTVHFHIALIVSPAKPASPCRELFTRKKNWFRQVTVLKMLMLLGGKCSVPVEVSKGWEE